MYGRLGLIYFQEEKFSEAVSALRKALKLKPGLPNTDVLLAMSLSELGQYEEALPGLEKGFKRGSDLPLRRLSGLQLVRAYTGLQQDSKAVEAALEMNRLFPHDAEVLYHTSRIYANFAYLTLRTLADVAPSSVWRVQASAEAEESEGHLDLALGKYKQVLEIDPARRGIHYRMGRVLLERLHSGQAESKTDALQEFQAELRLDPSNANAAYEIGEIYRKTGQLDRAREFFKQALKYYPDFDEAQVGLGSTLIALGKPELALPHLQKAIAVNPADEAAFYRLSQVYRAMGDSAGQQKAMAEFQRLRNRTHAEFLRLSDVTRQEVEPASPAQ